MSISYSDKIKKPNQPTKLTSIQRSEIERCSENVVYFAENYYKVVNPVLGVVNVILYDFQKEMLEGIQHNDFTMTVAARQSGKKLCNQIYMLWYAIFHPYKKVSIHSHRIEASSCILNGLKFAYENLPEWMKPGVTEYSQRAVVFENGAEIIARPVTPDTLRGQAISLLYIDEAAYIDDNRLTNMWACVMPAISLGGRVSIATSANKKSGLIYTLWDKSNSVYKQCFKWDCHPNRNQNWKTHMVNDIGIDAFNKEYNCEFSD